VRFTIERLRTLVLAAGILLLGALVAFLAVDKWKQHFSIQQVLKPLGVNVQQDFNGYTLSHAFGAHSQYKIHASKVVQLKNDRAILHDVKIELYDTQGGRVDRIEGGEFEYDQKTEIATASGPVEITLMRPGVAPAIAPKATPQQAVNSKNKAQPLATVVQTAETGAIHVRTSGLSFDYKSGVSTTAQRVDFSMVQGTGDSMGATYDSKLGHLVLDRAVELNTRRGNDPVEIHAQHAEFDRSSQNCIMHAATANYRDGVATAGDAKILFRQDGTAVHLDAMNGFTLTTATGSHLAAPKASMDFNEHNQPRHGHLQDGVMLDSSSEKESESGKQTRQVHGASPTAELDFTPQGILRHTHMERGVEMHSEELTQPAAANSKDGPLRVRRTWRSPVADVNFRDAGKGQVEPSVIHGVEGVVVTGESQRGNGVVVPSRLAADTVSGEFGPGSVLTTMTGTGHASMEETTAAGARDTATGDSLVAHFAAATGKGSSADTAVSANSAKSSSGAGQIQSAVLDGHVVLTQEPAAKPGARSEAPMRATSGHAVYEGAGEWLHLTVNPRVENGGIQLTADKVDVSQQSGDAFAHGNVKATWLDTSTTQSGQQARPQNVAAGQAGQGNMVLGGKGPAHAISAEAQLHQATGEVTFRGHARLWQQANSVSGPVIVLDRQRQTLVSRSTDPAEPVRAVLLSAGGPVAWPNTSSGSEKDTAGKPAQPSVIRIRGGDLKYSDAERKAIMNAGALGTVVAETGTATSVSNEVEVFLLSPGNHAGKDGGQAQVDRLTARGHVTLTSDRRHGTGEQLVYTSESGEYVLTGTAASPPRMTDPARGNVTGETLIFHSRDDSVSVEGRTTKTETTAPK
jgi:lipopolysaccharide export system protein LptA